MGLPEIIIDFKTQAETAVVRSGRGIVAALIVDSTKTDKLSYEYKYEDDIFSADWTEANRKYLSLIFKGAPSKVIVERMVVTTVTEDEETVSDADEVLAAALDRLGAKTWNWLCMPSASAAQTETLSEWIKTKRAAKKTYKAVLSNSASNHEGIVNFTTASVTSGSSTYTASEYTARIAGLLAGLPMTQSATYYVLDDITTANISSTPDTDIDAGKFIIINDGDKFKVGRAVNSLVTLSGDKTADMKSIKIIEGMDLIRDDIRTTFEENYVGVNNSYDNKMLFVGAVNQYFSELANEGVLYAEGEITRTAQECMSLAGYSDSSVRRELKN